MSLIYMYRYSLSTQEKIIPNDLTTLWLSAFVLSVKYSKDGLSSKFLGSLARLIHILVDTMKANEREFAKKINYDMNVEEKMYIEYMYDIHALEKNGKQMVEIVQRQIESERTRKITNDTKREYILPYDDGFLK